MKIWIVIIDHDNGTDHHAFHKYDDARDAARDFLETWFPPEDYNGPGDIPADYVEYVNGDTVVITETEVK